MKMSVVALTAALMCAPAAAQDVLDNSGMAAIAQASATFQPKDAFTPSPDESRLVGRRFRITMPLKEGEGGPIARAESGWTYDMESRALHLAVPLRTYLTDEFGAPPGVPSRMFRGVVFHSESNDLGDQIGQTAFGVEFKFSTYRGTLFAVGELTPPTAGDVLPANSDETLAVDRKMEPEEARKAVTDATVVIEGAIAPITPTRVSVCKESASEPTLTLPISSLIKTCLINVAVKRVTIESPAAGMLADWYR